MKRLLLCLAMAATVGCSVQPTPPSINNDLQALQEMELKSLSIPQLPSLPKGEIITVDGESMLAFDKDSLDELSDFRDAARQHNMALQESINATNNLILERNQVVRIAQEEQQKYNYMARKLAARDTEAREKERNLLIELWLHKLLLVVGIASYAL